MHRLIPFLKTSNEFPRFYWKPRGKDKACIGYGQSSTSTFTFKAQSFHENGCEGIWSSFPKEWIFSPEKVITADWIENSVAPSLPKCLDRQDTPTFEKWWQLVQDACQKIEKNVFRKVVLARQTTLTFDSTIDPLELLKGLMSFGNHTTLFMVQLDADTAFLGASPEKLYSRDGRKIVTEALAGTISTSESWSPKEFEEVNAVRTFLKNQLESCCHDLQYGSPEERPFGNLRHLYQKLDGMLKTKISDKMLIAQLHPTPALGGFPREHTMDYLRNVEPFHRGWYGAPIGLVSDKETDFAVAIRSMLVSKNKLHLFSGAGIVKGSEPAKEWEELNRKIAHILKWCDE
ncbi:MAG: isochorismate synthase [Rhabdochlamydiaceae bacterium]|nr:isochorismate synthase [Rhabdochlamydiaceae bacterium]